MGIFGLSEISLYPWRRSRFWVFGGALVLDKETNDIWDNLPLGERSQRVREALKEAELVNHRDMLVVALRKQIERRERIISDIRLLCTCKAIKAYLEGVDF